MPSGFTTPSLGLVVPNHGDFATTGWDSAMDPMLSQLDVAYGQPLVVTASSANIILNTAQASYPVLYVNGSLANDVIITYPNTVSGRRVIVPACAMNAFQLYVRGNNGVDQAGIYFWQQFAIPYGIIVTGGGAGSRVYWDYGGVQPGTVMDMMTAFCGNGWLPCDGRWVGMQAHDLLWDILQGTYGVSGSFPSGIFKLPDLRGAVLAMADNLGPVPAPPQGLSVNTGNAGRLNSWGLFGGTPPWGEAVHTLSTGEMPSHSHTNNTPHTHTASQVPHNHSYFELTATGPGPFGAGTLASNLPTVVSTAQPAITVNPAGVTVDPTGGSAAHNNVQPTVTTMKMIKW